ncbi:WD40 repeat domain-containing protein [Nonomuraea sp. NPDC049714]|uniref:WD40 repeat domain-containing protein n=1 Tax=Nonomuraea sp. NPDC049714 TaxID=3364357 RepID=UPI0037B28EDE
MLILAGLALAGTAAFSGWEIADQVSSVIAAMAALAGLWLVIIGPPGPGSQSDLAASAPEAFTLTSALTRDVMPRPLLTPEALSSTPGIGGGSTRRGKRGLVAVLAMLAVIGVSALFLMPGPATLDALTERETPYSLAFSPDGRMLATGGKDGDGSVRMWEVATGKAVTTFDKGEGIDRVLSLAFSPDGRRLAAASGEHTARVWDVATGKVITTFTDHSVSAVTFSPNGRTLAISGYGAPPRLLEVATGKLVATLPKKNADRLHTVAFSPDGRMLATGSEDGSARVWEVTTGKVITTLTASNPVHEVAFSPDGRTLAIGENGSVVMWEMATNKMIAPITSPHLPAAVTFGPGLRRAVTVSAGGSVLVWEVATGKLITVLNEDTDVAYPVALSPDGRTLAVGEQDGPVRLRQLD